MASSSFAAWREEASPEEASVKVCFDRQLYRRFTEATERLDRVRLSGSGQSKMDGDDDLDEAAQAVVDAEAALTAAERTLTFRQIGKRRWRKLVEQHPPTEKQKKEQPRAELDPETFWPAALAESCIDPDDLDVDGAVWMRDGDDDWPGLPDGQWERLLATVQRLHVEGSDLPKSVRSTVATLKRGLNSTT